MNHDRLTLLVPNETAQSAVTDALDALVDAGFSIEPTDGFDSLDAVAFDAVREGEE